MTVKGTTLTIPVTSMLMIVMILRMNILGFNYSLTRIMYIYIYIHTLKSHMMFGNKTFLVHGPDVAQMRGLDPRQERNVSTGHPEDNPEVKSM